LQNAGYAAPAATTASYEYKAFRLGNICSYSAEDTIPENPSPIPPPLLELDELDELDTPLLELDPPPPAPPAPALPLDDAELEPPTPPSDDAPPPPLPDDGADVHPKRIATGSTKSNVDVRI
jgi:hypothetical protein